MRVGTSNYNEGDNTSTVNNRKWEKYTNHHSKNNNIILQNPLHNSNVSVNEFTKLLKGLRSTTKIEQETLISEQDQRNKKSCETQYKFKKTWFLFKALSAVKAGLKKRSNVHHIQVTGRH